MSNIEGSHCSCGDVIQGSRLPIQKSLKPKSPSIERCLNMEVGQFRPRSNTLPTELKERIKCRPLARIARDPVQPSSGSLTKLNTEEHNEEDDIISPIMRRRSNTCPEKRALQMLKRRVRNRPPTPPPCDISPTASLDLEDGSPRERASSLTRSFERLGFNHLPELPEAVDPKELNAEEGLAQEGPSVFRPLVLRGNKVCEQFHLFRNKQGHDINCNRNNFVSINVTDSGIMGGSQLGQHCGKLPSCNCRSSAKDVPHSVHSKARLSLP